MRPTQTGYAVFTLSLAIALQGAAAAAAQNPGKNANPFVVGDRDQDQQAKEDEAGSELRADPRLQVPLNLELDDPTPQELLAQVQKATGVPLHLAKNLQGGEWKCGSLVAVNVPAWEILADMAVVDVTAGSWQKVDDGYRLRGKPKPIDPGARPAAPPSTPASSGFLHESRGLFLLVNGGISVLALTFVIVRYTKRLTKIRPQSAAAQSRQDSAISGRNCS